MSCDGTRVDTQNIEAVQNWPRPTYPIDIRNFFGFDGYIEGAYGGSPLFHPLLNK